MQYEITYIESIACITLEGNLNALDLMFMFQSKEYKDVIKQYQKIVIDYTDISYQSILTIDHSARFKST
ncbi:hypothetical protein [uncultured Paraglaciecola sp.]|uniref:hypothetical protein n=1 Tax=uncultured Paraglaciecola sp. TaxID=1765024 RepID=UPI002615FE0B|nr:hypothetical protein [uncultured Paraglaciecola sp.]